ncbi:DUF7510 family protein [Halobaculum lipolyticum]|uniref:Uncharacterized protein n=1 Tax=Halobaculum lipolyticum TaxID=3032001 RepID=A0ABD5WA86_9EURY|nr:hypothetical protein [Halobaculum sp. DT31]
MEGSHDDTSAADADAPEEDRPVSVDIDIADGRTTILVTGDRDAAVVVESVSGEHIYLPPEDFERPPRSDGAGGHDGAGPRPSDSPYQSVSDSPYQSVSSDSPYQSPDGSDSPYQRGGPAPEHAGLEPTADGFRILHPEPATDVRILR